MKSIKRMVRDIFHFKRIPTHFIIEGLCVEHKKPFLVIATSDGYLVVNVPKAMQPELSNMEHHILKLRINLIYDFVITAKVSEIFSAKLLEQPKLGGQQTPFIGRKLYLPTMIAIEQKKRAETANSIKLLTD